METVEQWVDEQKQTSPESSYTYQGPVSSSEGDTFSVGNTCAVCILKGVGAVSVGSKTHYARLDVNFVEKTFGDTCTAMDGAVVIWIIKND